MAPISKEFSISTIRSAFERCVEEARNCVLESSFLLSTTKKYRGHEFEIEFGLVVGSPLDEDGFSWLCPNYALEAPSLGVSEAEEPGFCEAYSSDGVLIAREARHELAEMLQSLRMQCRRPRIKALLEQEALNSQIQDPSDLSSSKQARL